MNRRVYSNISLTLPPAMTITIATNLTHPQIIDGPLNTHTQTNINMLLPGNSFHGNDESTYQTNIIIKVLKIKDG